MLAGFRDRILNAGVYVGGFALICLLLLIITNIAFRLSGHIIPGSYELAEAIIPVIAGVAVLVATLFGSHVAVDLVAERFSARVQRRLVMAMACVGFMYWLVLAYSSALTALRNTKLGENTELLGLPVTPLRWFWVAVCCCVAAYLLIALLVPQRSETE